MQYYAGIYMRLSKEDQQKGTSESIENQQKLLEDYCRTQKISIYQAYTDDGYSGTNFDRPAFQRMLSDAQKGKINMIIVKDASRLGRNSGQVDFYTNVVFSKLKLRYVAVADGIDKDYREADTDLKASFVNLMNEWYAGDISRKIRGALKIKMKNGEFIGSFAPFGYIKSPDNKNHLCIDEKAAETVRLIFSLAQKGRGAQDISDILNQKELPTPSLYRQKLHAKEYRFPVSTHWSKSSVLKILNNEVYLGHTTQGKTMKVSYKSSHIYYRPKEEQFVVAHTHEPIIDPVLWKQAHDKISIHAKYNTAVFSNMFAGIAFCADCGARMSSAARKQKHFLVCGNYKRYGKINCSHHYFDYDILVQVIKNILCTDTLDPSILQASIERIHIHQEKEKEQIAVLYMENPPQTNEYIFTTNNRRYVFKLEKTNESLYPVHGVWM